MFQPATYVARRQALCRQLDTGLVLLPGNTDSPMNYADNVYPFRQDSSFRYFFGLDQPGLVAVIDLDSGSATLFGEEPDLHAVVWTGPRPALAERAAAVAVEQVADRAALAALMADARSRGRRVHYLPPYRAATLLLLGELLRCPVGEIAAGYSSSLVDVVVALRICKSAEEVAEIEAALAVTAEMHVAAMRHVRAGIYEREVVGRMEGIVRERDWQLAYPVIFSHRGEVLHNHDHSHCLRAGEWIVNDAGASSGGGYASDITRTLPVAGRFSPLQTDLYNLVLEAQQCVCARLAPGVAYVDMHKLAARTLVEGLQGIGLFRGDPAEIVECGAYAAIFQCGLGHHMGLDVHDMENLGEDRVGYGEGHVRSSLFGLRSLRLAREVREGHVLTVEPGIYLIPELFAQWRAERRHSAMIDYAVWEKLIGVGGVRIEDDVLIEADGARVLGVPIPRSIAEVEAAMSAD